VPRLRKPLSAPHRQIVFRKEYIPSSQIRLILKPQGDPRTAILFKIIDDEDGLVKFTVTGRKFADRPCREFRDSSGLPLFELHQKALFTHTWPFTLPGRNDTSIAKGAPRWSFSHGVDDFGMSFENQAAVEAKEQHKRVKLTIERNGSDLALFDVVDGDRKVAVVGSENLQPDEEKVMLTYDDLNPKRKQSEVAWL
jgi:hypothetical protein